MRLSTGGSSGSSSDGSGNEEEEDATEKAATNAGTTFERAYRGRVTIPSSQFQ